MSADCPVLETLYQKAQSKQDQPDKSKPKCVGRKEGERANLTEQASQAKRHGNPKGWRRFAFKASQKRDFLFFPLI
ncbi:MAG: hypothetical protein DYG85_15860 [Chloroflexi bacterium CFX1]|nr:hypothetical protein [Chloroflexi bacterium CFX1]